MAADVRRLGEASVLGKARIYVAPSKRPRQRVIQDNAPEITQVAA